MAREPKKSETLEVRLSHPVKTAFMARCGERGQSASDAIRSFIAADLASGRQTSRPWRGWAAAALIGLGLGAVAAPSLAEGRNTSQSAFSRLDRDHDGVLSYAEFAAPR